MKDLATRFQSQLNTLLPQHSKVLAGVSGGVDSMTMLHLLVNTLGAQNVEVAHCNFGLRGDESDRETVLVETTCKQWGVKCHTVRFDTHATCLQTGENTQLAARRLRYEFFDTLISQNSLTNITIAHNLDDTIETFFINLLRGSGLRGLLGIPTVNQQIIRPLMFATRADILAYAAQNNVPFLHDSSNFKTDYLRNKLRHNILPLLSELSPDFHGIMADNMKRLSAHHNLENEFIDFEKGKCLINNSLDISEFMTSPAHSELMLYLLLEPYGFSYNVANDIYNGFESGNGQSKRYQSHSYIALNDRGTLIIEPLTKQPTDVEIINADDERVEYFAVNEVDSFKGGATFAFFDAEKLQFPLTVRSWHEGDRFVPFGMEGSKKVSDLLVDSKLSLFDKQNILVVLSGCNIVWVVGLRTDNRYRVTADTKRVVRICF